MQLLAFDDEVPLARKLAEALRCPWATVQRHRFPDGETRLRLPPALPWGVVLLCGLQDPNAKLTELLLAAAGARELGAGHLTLVSPYLAYMRQDMAFTPGEVVSQRHLGALLATVFDAVITVDPHLHRIASLDEVLPGRRGLTLSAALLLGAHAARQAPHALLLAPDEEAGQWVRAAAVAHGLAHAVCCKQRHGDHEVEVALPGVDVRGRAVVLLDDVASTGRTLAAAARGALAAGAASVDVAVTHALFIGDALAQVHAAGVRHVWSSDCVPHASNAVSVVPLLAEALQTLAPGARMSPAEPPGNVPLGELLELAEPGTPLPFAVLDAQGRLLLAAGKRLLDGGQLQALMERGGCVDPVEAQAAREARAQADGGGSSATAGAAARPAPAVRQRTWFDRMEKQVWALDELLRGLQRGTTKAAQLEAHADGYIALVQRHFDPALYLCLRQDDRRVALYALTHAMHSATVALLAARQLGWEPDAQRRVVLAALTMNASIVELQARMAEQTEAPNQRQMAQIRAHPVQSAQLLRNAGVDDAELLTAIEQHHERAGGAGYPQGLATVQPLGHLLRVADVFTAKISPRAVRAPLSPQVAARQLFQEEQGGPMAAGLIRAVGVYPPGDFVWLKNGDAAIVLHRAVPTRAVVVVSLFGANGKPVAGSPQRDTGLAEFAITGAITERGKLPRVLPEQVYGLLDADLPAP